MGSGAVNNFHMIVKQITKFDGRRVDGLLEWDFKLRASLSVYNKTIFNVLQWQERPSKFDADQEITRATWNTANQDVLFFTPAGSVFFVARRFQDQTPAEGAGHGQQAWTALREKFEGCLRAAIRAEHIRMTSTRMRPYKTPTTICTPWIATGSVSTRAIHRKASRIGNTRASYSNPFPRSTPVFVKPISRGETSALPTFAV